MTDTELVVVHTFDNRQEAEMAKSALEAAGHRLLSCEATTAGGMETGALARQRRRGGRARRGCSRPRARCWSCRATPAE